MELVIGDKLWSSWSMRPWLALRRGGFDFCETVVRLRRPDTAAAMTAAGAPAGKVPVLKDGDLVVWDSLAICEHLADLRPGLWPADPAARSLARSATAEMHAGFAAIRTEFPMDLARRETQAPSQSAAIELRRLVELWAGLRRRFAAEGPFLVGAWSIADAVFTPVATRLRSYAVDLSAHGDCGDAAAYAGLLLRQPEVLAWEADALRESGSSAAGGR